MPRTKEFTVTIEDKPGTLGRCLRALAERGVNILAFQSYVIRKEPSKALALLPTYCGLEPGSTLVLVVFGVDNLTEAATLLDKLAAMRRPRTSWSFYNFSSRTYFSESFKA